MRTMRAILSVHLATTEVFAHVCLRADRFGSHDIFQTQPYFNSEETRAPRY